MNSCLLSTAGVSDLDREDADKGAARKYALQVADTVVVPPEAQSSPEKETEFHLTHSCPKNWTDVAYFFKVDFNGLHQLAFRIMMGVQPIKDFGFQDCLSGLLV